MQRNNNGHWIYLRAQEIVSGQHPQTQTQILCWIIESVGDGSELTPSSPV